MRADPDRNRYTILRLCEFVLQKLRYCSKQILSRIQVRVDRRVQLRLINPGQQERIWNLSCLLAKCKLRYLFKWDQKDFAAKMNAAIWP